MTRVKEMDERVRETERSRTLAANIMHVEVLKKDIFNIVKEYQDV